MKLFAQVFGIVVGCVVVVGAIIAVLHPPTPAQLAEAAKLAAGNEAKRAEEKENVAALRDILGKLVRLNGYKCDGVSSHSLEGYDHRGRVKVRALCEPHVLRLGPSPTQARPTAGFSRRFSRRAPEAAGEFVE